MSFEISKMQADLNSFIERSREEIKNQGAAQAETVKAIDHLQRQITDLQRRGISTGSTASDPAAAIAKGITDNLGDFEKSGRCRFELKDLNLPFERKLFSSTSLTNSAPGGVIGLAAGSSDYGNIVGLFPSLPLNDGAVFQIRESAATGWVASPQTEGSDKNESTATLTGDTLAVKTIATWVSATKQALADVTGLQAFINGRLLWALAKELDEQVLSGDGTGENLDGLTTLATAFDTNYLSATNGWEYSDLLGAAAVQVRVAGFRPTFCILNPQDAFTMRHTKASDGQYIMGPPSLPMIVESAAMSQGTFVVGDQSQTIFRVRQGVTIDLSESHSDYFVKNKVAIRAELRGLLQTVSPSAFVYGSLSSSPA